jgi:hypothetical protein
VRSTVRWRIWLELGLSVGFAITALLTVIVPDWIEVFFGIEPDEGNGTAEVGVTVILLVLTVLFALAARVEIRSRSLARARSALESTGDR